MRINWFSPLPPARTEIANYTVRLLPLLCQRGDVTLWTDQPKSDLPGDLPAKIRQYRLDDPPWRELNAADANIYHIGNNPQWHASIWQISRRHPGVVVLHETSLAHLFLAIYLAGPDPAEFLNELARRYGESAVAAVCRFAAGEASVDAVCSELPFTNLATRDALGVLVHNRDSQDLLKGELSIPVMCASLPHVPRVPPPDPSILRQKYAATERYRLVAFGHIGANRRLDGLLRALASLPERRRFQLDVYGDVHYRDEILDLIDELSLDPIVQLHGYVPEATLSDALQRAHLAVNLRYPTMGEASASQLRIWDHALPSLVTPIGWYAHLPSCAVTFVRHEHETADLHSALRSLQSDPGRFAERGLAARRVLERSHTAAAYVEDLMGFATSCTRDRGRVAIHDLARRSAATLVNVAGPRSASLGFEAFIDQIQSLAGGLREVLETADESASAATLRSAA